MERFGENIPNDETVIAPSTIYNCNKLKTVCKK